MTHTIEDVRAQENDRERIVGFGEMLGAISKAVGVKEAGDP